MGTATATDGAVSNPGALASGAQYVWTDYRHPAPGLTDYQVRLPDDAVAIANPVRAAAKCAGIPLE